MDLFSSSYGTMHSMYSKEFKEANEYKDLVLTGHFASKQFKVIQKYIQNFEYSLDDSYEVGVKLALFGSSITLVVEQLSYNDPSLIIFHGKVDGQKATLIQNVNLLNFMLIALPREVPEEPKNRIGFVTD